jgi:hypothetical protein
MPGGSARLTPRVFERVFGKLNETAPIRRFPNHERSSMFRVIRRTRGWGLAGVLLVAGCIALVPAAPEARGAPAVEPWPRWEANDPQTTRRVDHSGWGAFLGRYVVADTPDGIHRVAYGKVTGEHKAELDAYVRRLQDIPVSALNRLEQKAYWINLYNALTVQVVLKHYPVASIRDIGISPGWFSVGPWDAELIRVEGQALTLNDIEHRILRPLWRDPRVHYAVNCASLGCPNLQAQPYDPARLDMQLDAAARAYVNHPRGARLVKGQLIVSSIYDCPWRRLCVATGGSWRMPTIGRLTTQRQSRCCDRGA